MKLTEKELNEFPIGTKITAIDVIGNKHLYVKCRNDYWNACSCWAYNHHILEKQIQRVEIPTYTEYIPPKPILDDKEKEYLSYVIKPWRKNAKAIRKSGWEEREFVKVLLKGHEMSVIFPYFKAGTMYKGMELDREYSLKELRIVRLCV